METRSKKGQQNSKLVSGDGGDTSCTENSSAAEEVRETLAEMEKRKLENERKCLQESRALLEDEKQTLISDQSSLETYRYRIDKENNLLNEARKAFELEQLKLESEKASLMALRIKMEEKEQELQQDQIELKEKRDKLETDLLDFGIEKEGFFIERKNLHLESDRVADEKRQVEEEKKRVEFELQTLHDSRVKFTKGQDENISESSEPSVMITISNNDSINVHPISGESIQRNLVDNEDVEGYKDQILKLKRVLAEAVVAKEKAEKDLLEQKLSHDKILKKVDSENSKITKLKTAVAVLQGQLEEERIKFKQHVFQSKAGGMRKNVPKKRQRIVSESESNQSDLGARPLKVSCAVENVENSFTPLENTTPKDTDGQQMQNPDSLSFNRQTIANGSSFETNTGSPDLQKQDYAESERGAEDDSNSALGFNTGPGSAAGKSRFFRPVNCTDCDKIFYSKSNLKRHRKLHGRQPSFICARCGKSFNRKDNRDNHSKKLNCKPFNS